MAQPSNSTLRFSGIPRLSKLPAPCGLEEILAQNDPVEHTLKSRAAERKPLQGTFNLTAPLDREHKFTEYSDQSVGARPERSLLPDSGNAAAATSDAPVKARTLPRRPRPSLSDRTIETLSQIPPSPSPRRRKSSFFPPESSSRSPSRPASSLGRSRPSTSHGSHPPLPSGFPTPRTLSPIKHHHGPNHGNQAPNVTSSRRSVSSYDPKSLPRSTNRLNGGGESTPSKSSPSVPRAIFRAQDSGDGPANKPTLKLKRGSKTLAARPIKQRPLAQDAFAKPAPKATTPKRNRSVQDPRVGSPTFLTDSAEPYPTFSPPSKRYSGTSSVSAGPISTLPKMPEMSKVPDSSATLRETISKAKAARRNITKTQGKRSASIKQETNPFPDVEIGGSNYDLLRKRIGTARTDGRLNIAALGLTEMPREVMNMYNANLGDGAWYESVDLVRLVAADNDFENLGDDTFPDDAGDSRDVDEDYQGNLFGGLETLDLHGNHLYSVPVGLRRLQNLTTLNLSKNCLGVNSLQVISQILPLRELRLAENALDGRLGSEICTLKNLELLDLHNNKIASLPEDLHDLLCLRVINIAGNRMTSFPFESCAALPLVELDASRNRLGGPLFPDSVEKLSSLKSLDVANNALTSIANDRKIRLPSLQFFNVTENRLTYLPDMSAWTEVLTVTAAGNRLASFPNVFSLPNLQTIDLTGNDIKKLDERVGLMDSLTVLRIANNPLMERKFLRINTDELKRELKGRLLPDEPLDRTADDWVDAEGSMPGAKTVAPRTWLIKTGGILDRSSTKLETIESSDFESILHTHEVKILLLHHNRLPSIPKAMMLACHSLTRVDFSHNKFAGTAYLPMSLSIPNLRSLDLSSNTISGLSPLLDRLSALKLAELNVSRNRLASLLPLRATFPSLVSLFASDNGICVLEVDVVSGLQVLDVSGNEIEHLEPKLGMLGAAGLRILAVGGNRFRVPRRDVVEKGTDAVLAWLKSRIPDEEMQGLG